MKKRTILTAALIIGVLFSAGLVTAQSDISTQPTDSTSISANEKLVVLWTSGDKDVAIKMVFMYTLNAKKRGWWEDITLVIWGPSAKILTEDKELQEYLDRIIESGVTVKACKGCSDQYGITEELEKLGINVLYIGKELTDYIKEGRELLTI